MNILPNKDYSSLFSFNQLYLPMDVGVLIPKDDSVRLLVFVLKQLDLTPLYEAYNAYGERRRREEAAREREAAQRGAGALVAGVSAYISEALEGGEGPVCRRRLKEYRNQRGIMGVRNSYSRPPRTPHS
jgi:hypothetical protein